MTDLYEPALHPSPAPSDLYVTEKLQIRILSDDKHRVSPVFNCTLSQESRHHVRSVRAPISGAACAHVGVPPSLENVSG